MKMWKKYYKDAKPRLKKQLKQFAKKGDCADLSCHLCPFWQKHSLCVAESDRKIIMLNAEYEEEKDE